jgi:4-amino-4-deoxy-L-arabinose transferase-like glycosyltransferase
MSCRVLLNPASVLAEFRDQPIKRQRTIFLSLAAVIGLFAYIGFLLTLPSQWQTDPQNDYTLYYSPVAANLISGKGFMLASKPALQYPPGIPLIYAATFWLSDLLAVDREVGIGALQAFFVMSSSVLIGLVAIQVFNLRVALVASVLWSTYPFQLWLAKQHDASPAVTTLLLSAVLLFLLWSDKRRHPLWFGVAMGGILGIAALIKPFTIALPIVFMCLAWICDIDVSWRQRSIFSVWVVIAYAFVISPWEVWAWEASGKWIPLCTNGPNALIDGLTFGTVRGLKQIPMPEAVRALTHDAVVHYQNLKTTNSIARFLINQARERPIALIELFSLKAVRSWYSSESHSFEGTVAMIQLCYLPLVAFGIRTAWRERRQQRNFVLVTLGVLLYFWAMTVFTALPILRYIVPAISLLLLCAAAVLKPQYPNPAAQRQLSQHRHITHCG